MFLFVLRLFVVCCFWLFVLFCLGGGDIKILNIFGDMTIFMDTFQGLFKVVYKMGIFGGHAKISSAFWGMPDIC